MKIGIILESNDPEKAWNAIRFANTALTKQHEVRLFLMGAGVEAESITHAKYNVREQLHTFIDKKGTVLACGSCIQGRNQAESAACPISTMLDCLNVVEWADKMLTF